MIEPYFRPPGQGLSSIDIAYFRGLYFTSESESLYRFTSNLSEHSLIIQEKFPNIGNVSWRFTPLSKNLYLPFRFKGRKVIIAP